jgi:hypothetical protein
MTKKDLIKLAVLIETKPSYTTAGFTSKGSKLLEFSYKTEDVEFSNLIRSYAEANLVVVVAGGKYKSMCNRDKRVLRLKETRDALLPKVKELIASETPEWQVLALKHGWLPSK